MYAYGVSSLQFNRQSKLTLNIVFKLCFIPFIQCDLITVNKFNRPGLAGAVLQTPLSLIAELQIKPKSKSNQTKNLERLYNWVVVVVVVVVVCSRRLGTRTNVSETEVE